MAEVLDYLINKVSKIPTTVYASWFISLISLWFTVKNNKAVQYVDSVTKNRVEWIDKLRKNISDFLALLDTQDLTDTILTPEEASKYPFDVIRASCLSVTSLSGTKSFSPDFICPNMLL